MIIPPHDPAYPRRVLELPEPPVLTVSGAAVERPLSDRRVIAIVGSRKASAEACNWTHQLAFHLARAGVVVVSGGALGIDQAAHRGAMKAGETWCVACTGRDARPYPWSHRELFRKIEASGTSRMIWPFSARTPKSELTPRQRNLVLVSLAEAVVIVQAGMRSGSLNAALRAFELGRPLYVVPGRPWDYAFLGSTKLILEGAASLVSIEQLFVDLELPAPLINDPDAIMCDPVPLQPTIRTFKRRAGSLAPTPLFRVDPETLSEPEKSIFFSLSNAPTHQDKIVAKSGLGVSATLTALLTLSLRDVVVEGPDGFFRLRTEA